VRAEAQVLVVAAEGLVVEVDVEELARVLCLGHCVHEVEPRHVLVRHLGVDADHLGVIESLDEGVDENVEAVWPLKRSSLESAPVPVAFAC
jgi:hypothetical protein